MILKKNIIFFKSLNTLMLNGKKNSSEKAFLKDLKFLQKNEFTNHILLLKHAIMFSSFLLKTRKIKRKKKKIHEFPFLIEKKDRIFTGIKLLFNSLKKEKKKNTNAFTSELIITCKNIGNINSKVSEMHEYAFKKKKYANFRWF